MCFILRVFLLNSSSVSRYKPPPICIKGAHVYIFVLRCSKSCFSATIWQIKKASSIHTLLLLSHIIKCYKGKFVL